MSFLDRPYAPLSRRRRAFALVYTFGLLSAFLFAVIALRTSVWLPGFLH